MQLAMNAKALSVQDPSSLKHMDQNDSCSTPRKEMQNGALTKVESVYGYSKKLQDDLEMLGRKIKQHEENIKFLKTQKNQVDDSILDMQVSLGKYHSASGPLNDNDSLSHSQSEEEVIEQILRHDKSAAGILCLLKTRHIIQASNLTLTKDVLGIVATLGKVHDENLSRLMSEYIGLENMLAIVCKTYEGVKCLETYDTEGSVNKSAGIHGLGASIGRHLDGRHIVICLDYLRPYVGEFVADDPQRRLELFKPRLPNGECPPGFLGFAVNMINVDSTNLYCVTTSGFGLRETLFYNLFSRLQVYRTRTEMLAALPSISDGALSLDGGIIRTTGIFSLGSREDVGVRFPVSSGMSNLPLNYFETENQIKEMNWRKQTLQEDMKREQALLSHAKFNFEIKKQEFVKFLAESSSLASPHQFQGGRERLTPR